MSESGGRGAGGNRRGGSPPSGARPGGSGIPLGRFLGVPVVLSPSWFIIAVVITFGYGGSLAQQDDIGPTAGYVGGFVFAVLLAASVLAHELAHTAASQRMGIPVRRVTLFLLGGVSETTREPRTPAEEYLVSVVGPLVSLVVGACAALVLGAYELTGLTEALVFQVAFANILVGVFNLLPGLPLDGGRVLRAVVWQWQADRVRATTVAGTGGKVVAALLGGLGGLLLFQGAVAAVTNAVILFLLSLFIWAGAEASINEARIEGRMDNLRVERLIRPTLVVPAFLSLGEAVRRARDTGARAIVVADSYGRPSAVVREADVLATPQERQPWVQVSGAATPIGPGNMLASSVSPRGIVDAVRTGGFSEYVVIDEGGSVLGVISTEDVLAVLGMRRKGRGA